MSDVVLKKYEDALAECERVNDLQSPVMWSIFPRRNDLDIDTGIELVRIDTDAPDGEYDVQFAASDNAFASNRTDARVTVSNGMFVIEPTVRAAGAARDDDGYWGIFLELLEYDANKQIFRAYFGS